MAVTDKRVWIYLINTESNIISSKPTLTVSELATFQTTKTEIKDPALARHGSQSLGVKETFAMLGNMLQV